MTSSKRRYDKAFKMEAIQLYEASGKTVRQIEADLDITPGLLNKWRAHYRQEGPQAFSGTGYQTILDTELRQLKRENAILRQERDILKHIMGWDWRRAFTGSMIRSPPAETSDSKMGAMHPLLLTDGSCCDF